MAKKKTTKTLTGTFEIRLVAPDLSPEKVPLRAVSDVLSAVQDLASGRDSFEEQQVPPDKSIGLVDVQEGSAVYCCLPRAPADAFSNLSKVASLLSSPEKHLANGASLVAALRPIRLLSDVAKSISGRVEVTTKGHRRCPLFVVQQDDYKRISKSLFTTGETIVVGTVERVGGATGMRCALRVSGRHRLLYCDVKTKDLVRRLGQHLYDTVAATGTARWIHRNWKLYEFAIKDFSKPQLGDTVSAVEALRNAGLSAWDNVVDPKGYIQELRS